MLISLSLYMVKHYWSFCYHWHIHLISVIEIKTQTRFMVLFTSGSLHTWEKYLDASPGISPRYLSVIYSQLTISPSLLQTSHHDRVCLFLAKSRLMEKRYGSNVGGISTFALYSISFKFLPFPKWNCPPWMALGLGGEIEILPWHHLPVSTGHGGCYRGQEIWSINHMGEP